MASAATFLFVLAAAASITTFADAASPVFPSPPAAPPPCAAPPPAAAFLRARCAATMYRVTCYDSLIPFACAFQTSPVKLARAATDVNHARLRALSKRVKELVALGGGGGGGVGGAGVAAAALRDCASTVSSAAGLSKQSAAELAKLDAARGAAAGRSEVRWAVSNAQTWLSAAMTNEVTCADGLVAAGGAASPASGEVVMGVVGARELTSIALALVNGMPLPP